MTDESLRELRRPCGDGDLSVEVRRLRARMRSGELSEARVRLAAWLGDEASCGLGFPSAPADERGWWEPFGDEELALALEAVACSVRASGHWNWNFEKVEFWAKSALAGDPTPHTLPSWPADRSQALTWLREALRGVPNGRERARTAVRGELVPLLLAETQ